MDIVINGSPYCSHCNYDLSGLTESSRCPECGRPLVDVLQRRGYGIGGTRQGKRYRSRAMLFGLPVIDIALGPSATNRIGRAKGIIAIGDIAVGFLSIGGICFGFVSVGGLSVGVAALGGTAISLLASVGGLSLSTGLAVGGCAIGTIAVGGAAIGCIVQGFGTAGMFERSFAAMFNRRPSPPIFQSLRWLLGPDGRPGALLLLRPAIYVLSTIFSLAAIISLVAQRQFKNNPGPLL